jgi:hypothetical protein
MYQGGNMWSAWDCYLTAFRDVLGLRLPQYAKYSAWERCAIEGGFRLMHPEFCMVSDFPAVLRVDADHRPHCDDGPSHLWRDGWALWHWHGVKVTEQIIMRPETITAAQVQAQDNAEVRRIMVERMGWARYAEQADVTVIHRDKLESNFPALPVTELVADGQRLVVSYRAGVETAELLECGSLADFEGRPVRLVRLTDPSTGRQYTLRVRHDAKRCYAAVADSFGMTEKQYRKDFYKRQGDVMLKPLSKSKGLQAHS